jgi:hypothetical protein
MANIIFPPSPTLNQVFTDSTTKKTWKWNGEGWDYVGKDLVFLIEFTAPIEAETFDVVAAMHNKFVIVDYPTTITATILEEGMLEGDVITFHQRGAGEIEFVVEDALNQDIWYDINKSSVDSRTVQLTRMPDNGSVKQYLLIGGVV